MGEAIQYDSPDGGSVPGYLATPSAGDSTPGVVVIQEWWGMNSQIKSVADRYAEQGYRALVPDLYRGRVTQDPDEANHMMAGMDWGGATNQDIRGAVQFLKKGGQKAAVLGFCMGGALTILAAVHIPELDAGVCFYGIPPKDAADPQQVHVPLQGHFANTDDWCTPDAVNALEADLKAGGVNFELFRYDAQHGFVNNERPEVYDATAATDAINRSLTFLKSHL